jgi:hypothetical protein
MKFGKTFAACLVFLLLSAPTLAHLRQVGLIGFPGEGWVQLVIEAAPFPAGVAVIVIGLGNLGAWMVRKVGKLFA